MQDPFKPVDYRPAPPPVVARSRWRWVVWTGVLLLVLLGAAVVFGPSLIDWNRYKGSLAHAVQDATGRPLTIAGDLSLEILPRPRLVAREVSLGNAPDGSKPQMVQVGRLEARLSPWPLLIGRFELHSLDLIQPTIVLERLPNGTGNWESVIQHISRQGERGRLRLELERVGIARGTAIFHSSDGTERRFEGIDAALTQSALGQITITGSGKLGQAPLTVETTLTSASGEGPIRVLLTGGEGELELTGALRRGQQFEFQGKLRVKTPSLAHSLTAFALAPAPLPAGFDQRFAAETDLHLAGTQGEATGLRLEFGSAVAGGKADVNFDTRKLSLELAMSRLDLDAWPKDPKGTPWPIPALPSDWSASARVSIEALVWQAGIISQVSAAARMEQGQIAIDQAKALLPGGSDLTVVAAMQPVEGGRWRWTGRVNAASDNLRGLLQWLGAEPAGVPADRLRKLTLKARLSGLGSNLDLSDIDAQLDTSHITGGVAVLLRARPGFGIGLAVDQINLDAYLPPPGAPQQGENKAAPAPNLFSRLDANFNIALSDLTYAGQSIRSMRAEGTLQNGDLTLRQLSARTPSGGSGRLAGRVTGATGAQPNFELDFDLAAKDGAELVRLAGLSEPGFPIGGLSVSGTAAGKIGAMALDVTVLAEALEADAHIVGTVAAARPTLLGSGKVQVQFREPGKLSNVLDMEPARLAGFGPTSVEGDVSRDANRLSLNLTLKAPESKLTAQLAGTRTGKDKDYDVEGKFDGNAENGGPVLVALGIDPAVIPAGPVSATLTASGRLGDLAIEGEATADKGRIGVRGQLGLQEKRSYNLAITADHPDLPRLVSAMGYSAGPLTGPLALRGKLSGGGDRVAFTIDPSKFGSLSVSGQGDITFADPRPKARVALALDQLPLAIFGGPFQSRESDAAVGAGWTTRPIDWSLLTDLDADATVSADAAVAGVLRIEKPKAELALADGRLTLKKFEGTIAQGKWAASGVLEPEGRNTASITLALQGAQINESPAWAGLKLAKSKLSLGLDLTSRGASAAELIQGLEGSGRLLLEGGTLEGIDLGAPASLPKPAAGKPGPDPDALANAIKKGQTAITKLEGRIAVEQGVARATDLALITPTVTGHGTLSLDLLAWQSEGEIKVSLIDRPELPPLDIELAGLLDAPQLKLDTSAVVAALTPKPEPQPEPAVQAPAVDSAPPPPAVTPAVPGSPAAPAAIAPQAAPPAANSGANPQPQPTPAPAPAPAPSTDTFIKGILDKLNKQPQP
jgi:uncharacterized protein involved in outer membrane biogenesis